MCWFFCRCCFYIFPLSLSLSFFHLLFVFVFCCCVHCFLVVLFAFNLSLLSPSLLITQGCVCVSSGSRATGLIRKVREVEERVRERRVQNCLWLLARDECVTCNYLRQQRSFCLLSISINYRYMR